MIGARLGHCLFYEPSYYLSHPLEMILPVTFPSDGGIKFTGYPGVLFERVDSISRHPAQLYEAISYFIICGFMIILNNKMRADSKIDSYSDLRIYCFLWRDS